MSYQRNLKISITGNAASGKTNIALLIKDTLAEHGIDIEIHDAFDDIPVNTFRENRKQALENLSKQYEGRKIVLDLHSAVRVPIEIDAKDEQFESSINRPAKEYNYTPPTFDEIVDKLKHQHFDSESEMSNIRPRTLFESDFITYENNLGEICVYKSRYEQEMNDKLIDHLWRL